MAVWLCHKPTNAVVAMNSPYKYDGTDLLENIRWFFTRRVELDALWHSVDVELQELAKSLATPDRLSDNLKLRQQNLKVGASYCSVLLLHALHQEGLAALNAACLRLQPVPSSCFQLLSATGVACPPLVKFAAARCARVLFIARYGSARHVMISPGLS